MKRQDEDTGTQIRDTEKPKQSTRPHPILRTNIADSIDLLVEYLVDNDVRGIHPLIMGEVEKRLIIKVLERSRGNTPGRQTPWYEPKHFQSQDTEARGLPPPA